MGYKEDLEKALREVKAATEKNECSIVHTREVSRFSRELLTRTKWLIPIIKGWYMVMNPDQNPGDSVYWYANYWKFVAIYLEQLYGTEYCLSAENSLDLHTKSNKIPEQLIVILAKGSSSVIELPFKTSILTYSDPKNLPEEKDVIDEIQVMKLPYALCKITPKYFEKEPIQSEIALKLIRDPSYLIEIILEYDFKSAASRLIGAYDFLGKSQMSGQIKRSLERVGYKIKPNNPFTIEEASSPKRIQSPYEARIHSLWKNFRNVVIDNFPEPTSNISNIEKYLSHIDEIYQNDAYNSLSIEGFKVEDELISRVCEDDWNPENNQDDNDRKNALAARGYFEAFLEVKDSIKLILSQEDPGKIIERDLSRWYESLFNPFVKARILQPNDLIGYRKHQVYIRNSRHVPLPSHALVFSMDAFFDCLKNEEHPAARAVLGHFLFGFIHPYMDGNGRLARFLMNAMLASGGYPWTIVEVKRRKEYLSALEEASVNGNIKPFTLFLADEMNRSEKL